jgi:hypothetical protein
MFLVFSFRAGLRVVQEEDHAPAQDAAHRASPWHHHRCPVTAHNIQGDVATDLRNMLETDLLKDDRRLRSEDKHPDSLAICTITEYAPPKAKASSRSTYVPGSKKSQQETVTRYSGILKVAYQACISKPTTSRAFSTTASNPRFRSGSPR